MMGFAFISLFVSNNLIGRIGSFYEKMSPVEFWLLQAAIAAAGGVAVMVFGRALSRALGGRMAQAVRRPVMTVEAET
jgi:POT family proton-dependent oligopeptide transporter